MAYTAPATVVAGTIYTPTMYNTYLQNNADSGYARMLADTTLGVASASIDFTSIPQTFAHLMVEMYLRGDTAATTTTYSLRFNADSGANYDVQSLQGAAAVASAAETFAATGVSFTIPAGTATANVLGRTRVDISHYAGSANNKIFEAANVYKFGTASSQLAVQVVGGFWRSNAAINRITLATAAGNFAAGSRVTIYGLPQ